ncbi:MAG: ArsR/SmtB family transcription factor [Sandaracinaceae bacterium]
MSTSDTCTAPHPPRAPAALHEPAVVARAASLLRAMGDPARLRLLEQLAAHGEQCVSELAEASGDGMSTVSQRLRLLRSEHLVSRRRDGKHIHYSLRDDHVRALITAALEHAAES